MRRGPCVVARVHPLPESLAEIVQHTLLSPRNVCLLLPRHLRVHVPAVARKSPRLVRLRFRGILWSFRPVVVPFTPAGDGSPPPAGRWASHLGSDAHGNRCSHARLFKLLSIAVHRVSALPFVA